MLGPEAYKGGKKLAGSGLRGKFKSLEKHLPLKLIDAGENSRV